MNEIKSFELDPNSKSFSVGSTANVIARLEVVSTKKFKVRLNLAQVNKFYFVHAGSNVKNLTTTQYAGTSSRRSLDISTIIKLTEADDSEFIRITARLENSDGDISVPVIKNLKVK